MKRFLITITVALMITIVLSNVVSAARISFIGTANTTGNNPTSGNFTLPAGWAAGDVAVFWWYTENNTKTLVAGTPWGITSKQDVNSSGFGHIFIGYRTLVAGDSTFGWTSSTVNLATTIWGTSVFRGVNRSGDPFEAQSGAPATFTDTSSPDPPAVTTKTNGAWVIPIFGKNNDYLSITVPTGYTSAGSNDATTGNDASAGVAYREIASIGTEDPGPWSAAGTANDDGYVWTGALMPAAENAVFFGTNL